MNPSVLETTLHLPQPRSRVFPFFADAHNLQVITPPWLHFEVLTKGPLDMRVGLRIDYRLRIHGVPVRWQSEITAWDPPHRFVDEQRRGPYNLWHHEHRFEERDGGTTCVDVVHFRAPGGPLRPLIERLFVQPDVRRIFAYRTSRLLELFPAIPTPTRTPTPQPVDSSPPRSADASSVSV
ncbi:MAG: SRPBCC family protein [Limisphaerales bacterium]